MLSRSFCYGNGGAAENAYAALTLLDNRQLLFTFFALREKFLNVLISPHVFLLKGSKGSSKIAIYYLCNQPFHFSNRAVRGRMSVIV